MQVIIAEKTPLEDGDMMKTISDEGEGTVPKSPANVPSNKSKFPQRNSSIGSASPPKSGNVKECEWVLESGKVYVCGERFTGSDSLDQHMRRHKEKEIDDVRSKVEDKKITYSANIAEPMYPSDGNSTMDISEVIVGEKQATKVKDSDGLHD